MVLMYGDTLPKELPNHLHRLCRCVVWRAVVPLALQYICLLYTSGLVGRERVALSRVAYHDSSLYVLEGRPGCCRLVLVDRIFRYVEESCRVDRLVDKLLCRCGRLAAHDRNLAQWRLGKGMTADGG